MKQVAEDEEYSSDISGYHSDSDSAIMMSANSPYVSKRARYIFLSRSGKEIVFIITQSVLGQVHSLFQSEFSRECNIGLPLSRSNISLFLQGDLVAPYIFFLLFPSLLSLLL